MEGSRFLAAWILIALCAVMPCIARADFINLTAAAGEAEYNEALRIRIGEIVAEVITDDMDVYEKALALHDWIVDNVTYQFVDAEEGTDYKASDAILYGRGVCSAYTFGYAELLDAVGIENDVEYGTDHVWNMVRMDDEWYHVDCTWDDGDSCRTFFFLPNEAFDGVLSHECTQQKYTGHDYRNSYLYRYGYLDKKIDCITEYIQTQFDLGIYEFQFVPSVSIDSSSSTTWGAGTVERNLVKMILPELSFMVGGEEKKPEIEVVDGENRIIVSAEAPEDGETSGGEEAEDPDIVFTYRETDDNPHHTITGYTGTASRVVIPDGVEAIGGSAFKGCMTMKELYIPDSVTTVGHDSFMNCANLKTVRMSDHLLYLGSQAFEGCVALERIELPEGMISIGLDAFVDCLMLKSANIPSTVTSFGPFVFMNCQSLEEIVIPASVGKIGYRTFDGCVSLKKVTIENGITELEDIAFGSTAIESIELPPSLTVIGQQAFKECRNLKEIQWPESVTKVQSLMFYGCEALTEIEFPDTVTEIGVNAMGNCKALKRVVLPKNLTTLKTYTFFGCTSLTEIDIPDSVMLIDEQAFSQSNPVWIVSDGSYAQMRAAELGFESRIRLCRTHGNAVIDPEVEATCTESGLTEGSHCGVCGTVIVEQKEVAAKGHTLSFDKLIYETAAGAEPVDIALRPCDCGALAADSLIWSVSGSALLETTAQEIVRFAADACGVYSVRAEDQREKAIVCTVIVHDDDPVRLPAGTTHILEEAFAGIAAQEVVVPDSVVLIGSRAFARCGDMALITLPDGIEDIAPDAFDGCGKITVLCPDGSYAQTYAQESGIHCIAVPSAVK